MYIPYLIAFLLLHHFIYRCIQVGRCRYIGIRRQGQRDGPFETFEDEHGCDNRRFVDPLPG